MEVGSSIAGEVFFTSVFPSGDDQVSLRLACRSMGVPDKSPEGLFNGVVYSSLNNSSKCAADQEKCLAFNPAPFRGS